MSGGVYHLVLTGPLILAAPIAVAAGAITFLSPCCLPLVPGYLSYVTGMSGAEVQRAGARRRPAGQPPAPEPPGPQAPGPQAPGPQAPGPQAAAARGATSVAAAAATTAAATGRGGGGGHGPAGSGTLTVASPRPTAVPRGRTVLGTFLFVIGFSAVFAGEGLAFGSLGVLLQRHSAGVTQVLGGVTIVLGLLFAGVFDRLPVTGRIMAPSVRPRAGLAGAPLLGVLFALSWTPCAGPTLTAVLTLSFSSGGAVRGAILAFIYGLGLGIPFLIMAFAVQRGMTAFQFARRHAQLITRIGGGLLVLVGILEVSGAWNAMLLWLKFHWISSYSGPL